MTTAEPVPMAEVCPTIPADHAASPRRRQEIEEIVLTATDELRNNTENQPLQYAAIELAARRLHRYADARIEAIDRITESALDCGLDPNEIQKRLSKGLTAAAQGAGRFYDFKPLDLHDLVALTVPPREMVLAPIIPAKGLVMLYAFRGGCKTHIAHGIAVAVSTGGTFLKWMAPRPRKVLLVDGELPTEELQQRLKLVTAHRKIERGMFEILAADQVRDGIGNFADVQTQNELDAHLKGVELLILDNLSSLTTVIRDNDAEHAPLSSASSRRTAFAADRVARNGDREANPVRILGQGQTRRFECCVECTLSGLRPHLRVTRHPQTLRKC